jgi:hypothetical protein
MQAKALCTSIVMNRNTMVLGQDASISTYQVTFDPVREDGDPWAPNSGTSGLTLNLTNTDGFQVGTTYTLSLEPTKA